MFREFSFSQKATERFWRDVDTSGDCWNWTGGVHDQSGYGRFTADKKPMLAHRFSYAIHQGAYDPRWCVLHQCDNPKCVRPTHLFLGTKGDNNRDRHAKGRDKKYQRIPSIAKVTPLQTDAILALNATGDFAGQELAELFGLSAATVSRVIRGQRKFQRGRV